VGHNAVGDIMRGLGLKGLPRRRLPRGAKLSRFMSLDLVGRKFRRDRPNELWVTDITEHPTREGKIYCCVVLDTFSRKVVGWSIDATQTTSLVLNALGMATQRRPNRDGLVMHSDRGVQFTSWAFSHTLTQAGISPSMGAVGSAYDNALMESFWGRMQVELFNRRKWKTRIELAGAIHDYIELWHNPRRRHSALGMRTPIETEAAWLDATSRPAAATGAAATHAAAIASARLRRAPATAADFEPQQHPSDPSFTIPNDNDQAA
jgi:putative transposase